MSRANDGDDRAYRRGNIDIDDDDNNDLYVLDHIPLRFLEAYPFPAFVVDEGLNSNGKDLGIELLWGNERWLDVSGSAPLDECTNPAEYAALASWMRTGEGIYPLHMRQGAASFVLHLVKTTTAVATIVTCQPGWDYEPLPYDSRGASRSPTPVSDRVSIESSADHTSSSNEQTASSNSLPVPSLSHSSEWEVSADSGSSSEQSLPSAVSMRLPNGTTAPSPAPFAPRTSSPVASSASPSPYHRLSTPANGGLDCPRRVDPAPTHQGAIPSSSSAFTRGRLERPLPKHHNLSTNFTSHDLPPGSDLANILQKQTDESFALVKSINWDQTPLGGYDTWPQGIKTALQIMLSSPTLDTIWWGPIDNIHIFYNTPYRALVNHPADFGAPARVVWATLWQGLEPLIQKCIRDGQPTYHKNDLVFYRLNDRDRYIEQYHTWTMTPIIDRDTIVGAYSMCLDTTLEVLAERRAQTTQALADELPFARSKQVYYDGVADVLEANPIDVPFAILYQVDEQGQTDRAHVVSLTLKSTVGIPHAHSCAPEQMMVELPVWARRPSLNRDGLRSGQSSPTIEPPRPPSVSEIAISHERGEWPIARALSTRQCVIVDNCADLIKGVPVRQWDDLPDQAIVIPIIGDTSDVVPPAVLILGINRHSQLDDTYLDWVHTMRGYLANALVSINTFESAVLQLLESESMELVRAKTTWIRGAAAELLEPLSIIFPPLERVLRSPHVPKHHLKSLMLVQSNIQRLESIVAMLLDFNHIETGRMTGQFIRGDLGEFVTGIVDLFVPVVDSLGIKITVRTEQPLSQVSYDPVLLEVVIANLLASTVKKSNSSFIAVSVDYEVNRESSGWAHVAIIDPQVGIPIDAVDGAAGYGNTAPRTHAGLALNLAKEIVGLHGGAITAKSGSKQSLDSASYNIRLPLGGEEDNDVATPGATTLPFGAYTRQAAAEVVEAARGFSSQTDESSSITSTSSLSQQSNRSQSRPRIGPKRPGLERRIAESHLDTTLSLDEARQQQELFAGCISHEIRTPVNAILQCSSVVKDNLVTLREHLQADMAHGVPPHFVKQLNDNVAAIESIYQCALMQERLAGDVQSLALARVDNLALHFAPVSVREVVQRTANMFTAEAQAKNIDMQVVFGPTLDAMALAVVKTDPVRISQVVSNTIANVLRGPASQTKVVSLTVEVALDPPESAESCALPDTANAVVSNYNDRREGRPAPLVTPMIEDTGVYIYFTCVGVEEYSVDPLARRSSEATATVVGSTGLGLYISRMVTELLGGRMEVKTTDVGSETRFFIEARAANPANPFSAHAAVDGAAIGRSRSASPEVAAAPLPLHVLIVEDSLISQTILKRQMIKAGFVCDIANNGVEALDALGINVGTSTSPSPPASSASSTLRSPLKSYRRPSWPHQSANRRHKSTQSSPGLTSASSLVLTPPSLVDTDTGSSSTTTPSLPSASSEHSSRRYDVVLMDLDMPIMDGITAVRHLRAYEDANGCERQLVMALTNHARQGQIDAALAAGMDEVILKPYRLPKLIKAVHQAVDRAERGEWA